ncbi:hypothetical protein KC19_1G291800 [Ceratodon purpureus]|uniref:Uncharacterized protein n=1 Tax=Ceratodon purpureus TaxID=3225 RepID=A0A8T0JC96_CERPU|nr:hypothetical protein KC19_1G291800 [Ceratodon purpureus]
MNWNTCMSFYFLAFLFLRKLNCENLEMLEIAFACCVFLVYSSNCIDGCD